MKKIALIMLALVMLTAFVGCDTSDDKTQETKPQHTVPPTDTINSSVEWASVLCDLQLNDSKNEPVIIGDDFEMFALMGSTDTDSYITIKVSDNAKEIIKAMPDCNNMKLLINNVEVATISIDPATFDGEIEFGHSDTFSQLCEFANIIRGLY